MWPVGEREALFLAVQCMQCHAAGLMARIYSCRSCQLEMRLLSCLWRHKALPVTNPSPQNNTGRFFTATLLSTPSQQACQPHSTKWHRLTFRVLSGELAWPINTSRRPTANKCKHSNTSCCHDLLYASLCTQVKKSFCGPRSKGSYRKHLSAW